MTAEKKKQMGLACLVIGALMFVMLFMGWHVAKNEENGMKAKMSANAFQLTGGKVGIDVDIDDDAAKGMGDFIEAMEEMMNKAIGARFWYILALAAPVLLVVFGFMVFSGQGAAAAGMGKLVLAALVVSLLLSFMAGGVNYGGDMAKYMIAEMEDHGMEIEDKGEMIKEAKKDYREDANAGMGFGAIATLILAIGGLVVTAMVMQAPAGRPAVAAAAPAAPAAPAEPDDA
jgi:hypothetical protein